MPAAVDWSWGQAVHSPTPFPSVAMLPQHPGTKAWPLQDPSSSNGAQQQPDIWRHGFKVNAFRTAVPSPATESMMPTLELQPEHHRKASMAGRKRSRAELFDDDSSDPISASSTDDASGSPNKIFRSDKDALNASTQNGVRAEELAERLLQSTFPNTAARPPMREARKSIRLDPDATAFERAQLQGQNDMMVEAKITPQIETALSHQRGPSGHDEAALTLGVGWSSIPASPVMLAAARGWARYIESTFPLRNVRVVWKNEGLDVFLVSAATLEVSLTGQLLPGSPGYYLFDEAMSQGKLVAKSWERSVDNLRAQPIQFDGAEALQVENEGNNATWADAADLGSDRAMGMEID